VSKILTATAIVVGVGMALIAFVQTLSIPIVQFSYSTRECVSVIEVDGTTHSCPESLPERYSPEWVR
jgi:hypothetical protein